MKNVYHNDIMEMLLQSGRTGMNVRQLARRLYNIHNDIFAADIDYRQLYNQVRFYLYYQSRQRHSPFLHLHRGQYALRQDVAVQLDIFIDAPREEEEPPSKHTKRDDSRQLLLF